MTRQREAFLFFVVLFLVLAAFLVGASVVWGYFAEWRDGQLHLAIQLDILAAAAVAGWQTMQAYRRGSP